MIRLMIKVDIFEAVILKNKDGIKVWNSWIVLYLSQYLVFLRLLLTCVTKLINLTLNDQKIGSTVSFLLEDLSSGFLIR